MPVEQQPAQSTATPPPTARLMGARFRPPAAVVLQYLPAGTTLRAVPEPDNAYDPHAVCVMLDRADFPSCEDDPQLEEHLAGCGVTRAEFEAMPKLHLGYIERTFAPQWATWTTAELRFDGNGFPIVVPTA